MAVNTNYEDFKKILDQKRSVHLCTQCQLDGLLAQAVGYCIMCVEYLCEICYRRHCQPSATRNHILLNYLEMPDIAVAKTKDKFDEICKEHKGIVIKYFCQTCDALGCFQCMRAAHKKCTGVTYIPDHIKTKTLRREEIYTDSWYRYSSGSPMSEVQKVKDKIKRYKFGVELKASEARLQVKKFREGVAAALAELQNEMENKINIKSSEDLLMLDMLMNKCNTIQEEFEKMKNVVERNKEGEDNNCLFVCSKIASEKVKEFENKKVVESLAKDLKIRNIKFEPNFKDYVSQTMVLGDIVEVPLKPTKKKWEVIGQIQTKTGEEIEKSYCAIRACTVLENGKLIVCDISNNSVRLCNTEIAEDENTSNVISVVQVEAAPKGITQIFDDYVAVTLPAVKMIQFIELLEDDKMKIDDNLAVSGECVGIGCVDENLIVTFINPGKVEIMELDGQVLKTVGSEEKSDFSFSEPRSVACDETRKLIYISDFLHNSVVAVNLEGRVRMVFKDSGMKNPLAIALGKDGSILVAVKWPYSVQIIDRDFLEIETLKVRDDTWGIEFVAYSAAEDNLFYGTGGAIVNVRKIN